MATNPQVDTPMSHDSGDETRAWKVTSFDPLYGWGRVECADRGFQFHSTSYHAPTHRWPVVGEPVDVVLTPGGELLAVWGQ